MTDTMKLQGKMRELGKTIPTLSKEIGISQTALFNKIHNKRQFLASEIVNLNNALHLSQDEVFDIFLS